MGHYRQWEKLSGKGEILNDDECCESFAGTDVRGETIPDKRIKTSAQASYKDDHGLFKIKLRRKTCQSGPNNTGNKKTQG